ncbi:MAG: glycosyl transferase [Alphaproteobacteria bacterium]|nr:MAG: glycosyl transferase [Alphaproteobacteria bacterium]
MMAAEQAIAATPTIADAPAKAGRLVVLQVLPRLGAGGAERGTIDVAGAIVAAGGTAIVASAGGSLVHDLARLGAIHETLPLDSKNPFVIHANIRRIEKLIRRYGVHIVHARSRAPAWSAFVAARRSGAHFVTTFHSTYGLEHRLKWRYNAIMTRGERVIAISDFIAGHIRQNYPIDEARLRVIHRGVDLARFDPDRVSAERVIQLARQWRIPDDMPVVMLPGRVTRRKGHDLLIEAVALLKDRELRCLMVGPDEGRGTFRRELEEMAARLGVDGRIQFAGECRDMPAAYKLADVVVAASSTPEAFGRIIAEAQAMGRPVVATDHGGAREQLSGGRMAWLTPPDDPVALAQAIDEALDLPVAERELLAPSAIANVHARFSKDTMCARTLMVYRELVPI